MQKRVENNGVSDTDSRAVPWVIGPSGERLTRTSLPPAGVRWNIFHKAKVVAAVAGGIISLQEVLDCYALSIEEFAHWKRSVDHFGVQGLRATRAQEYRDRAEKAIGWN